MNRTGNISADASWQWPLDLAVYDRAPELTEAERAALLTLGWHTRQGRTCDLRRPEWAVVERLFRPLEDARRELHRPANRYHERSSRDAVALILHACMERRTAFWAWDAAVWTEVFGPDHLGPAPVLRLGRRGRAPLHGRHCLPPGLL